MRGQINISKLNNNNKKIDSKVKGESRKNEGMSRAAKKRRKKQEYLLLEEDAAVCQFLKKKK